MTNIDELKSTGLKATLPRLKILDVFHKGEQRHMTAEDVFRVLLEERTDIGLATVYRVLTQFEQAGILTRSHFESGKAVYELNEGTHHDHLVCLDCGRVEEFYDAEIEKRQNAVAKAKGFAIADHALSLYAHCTKNPCPHRPASVRQALTALLHRAAMPLDELLVGVDATQLQDGVAHRGFHQHARCCGRPPPGSPPCAPARPARPASAARTAAARIRAPWSRAAPGARSASSRILRRTAVSPKIARMSSRPIPRTSSRFCSSSGQRPSTVVWLMRYRSTASSATRPLPRVISSRPSSLLPRPDSPVISTPSPGCP
jgi:Fur family ferric uptake transcriptional regulator